MISFLLYKLILAAVIFVITLFIAAYSTYAERKVAAFLQDRIGPDRAGPFGMFQPLADGLKFIMKEEFIPVVSNKLLFILGTVYRDDDGVDGWCDHSMGKLTYLAIRFINCKLRTSISEYSTSLALSLSVSMAS